MSTWRIIPDYVLQLAVQGREVDDRTMQIWFDKLLRGPSLVAFAVSIQ